MKIQIDGVKMTKEEALQALDEVDKMGDEEDAHIRADEILIEFINDEDIAKAFDKIKKWYA